MRTDPEAFQKAVADYRTKAGEFDEAYSVYDEETISAVDAFRKDHDLDHQGNPHGLVDDRLVQALRQAYRDALAELREAGS